MLYDKSVGDVFYANGIVLQVWQVEAYGSEKGQLSVDDITNVLKKHS